MNVYVEIKVTVKKEHYSYGKPEGESQVEFVFPLHLLGSIDPGNLFAHMITQAAAEYVDNAAKVEKAEDA